MKKYIKILLALIALFACITLTACSEDLDYVGKDAENGTELPILLHQYDIEAETDEVGKLKDSLEEKCQALGGYIEDKDVSYSGGECYSFDIVYRIPEKNADAFISHIEKNSELEYLRDDTSEATSNNAEVGIERSALVEKIELLEDMLYDNSLSANEKNEIVDEIAEAHKKIDKIDKAIKDARFVTVELSVSEKPSALDNFMSFVVVFGIFAFYPVSAIVTIIVVVTILKKNRKKKAKVAE